MTKLSRLLYATNLNNKHNKRSLAYILHSLQTSNFTVAQSYK